MLQAELFLKGRIGQDPLLIIKIETYRERCQPARVEENVKHSHSMKTVIQKLKWNKIYKPK